MTRDEFEQGYAYRSGITVAELRSSGYIVRPCHCGEVGCDGWQIVSRDFAELEDLIWPDWNGAEVERDGER